MTEPAHILGIVSGHNGETRSGEVQDVYGLAVYNMHARHMFTASERCSQCTALADSRDGKTFY